MLFALILRLFPTPGCSQGPDMDGAGIRFPKLALLLRYLVFTHRMLKDALGQAVRR